MPVPWSILKESSTLQGERVLPLRMEGVRVQRHMEKSPWRALKEKGSTSLAQKTLLHECLEIRGANKRFTCQPHL